MFGSSPSKGCLEVAAEASETKSISGASNPCMAASPADSQGPEVGGAGRLPRPGKKLRVAGSQAGRQHPGPSERDISESPVRCEHWEGGPYRPYIAGPWEADSEGCGLDIPGVVLRSGDERLLQVPNGTSPRPSSRVLGLGRALARSLNLPTANVMMLTAAKNKGSQGRSSFLCDPGCITAMMRRVRAAGTV